MTTGSYDGVEICNLVGINLLSLPANIIDRINCGLYRDDGLILLHNVNGQKMDLVRKNVTKIFAFKIEIQTHLKKVNFLDITFNLANGTYKPYKKMIPYCISTHPSTTLPKLSSSYQNQITND